MKILYQDHDILVCIKPAGVVSTDEPGGMPELIRRAFGEDKAVRTVHRLDAVVSGLMVFALSKEAASLLSSQITGGTFLKEYLAVTEGAPAEKEAELHDYLHRDPKERKTYAVAKPARDAQEAALRYSVCEKAGALSLVRIELITGRTHQIRAQFSSRGLPLYGDRKYGAKHEAPQLALWSCHLRFCHPISGQVMDFAAMPPEKEPWTAFSAAYYEHYDEQDVAVAYQRPATFGDCRFANTCAGCAYQGMAYSRQLEKKQKLLSKSLGKYIRIPSVEKAEQPFACKHKTTWMFSVNKSGQPTCFSYTLGSKASRCMLNHKGAAEIAQTLLSLTEKYKVPIFDPKKCSGWLRYAVIRVSSSNNDAMLTIVGASLQLKDAKALLSELTQTHPEVKTVILNANSKASAAVLGKEERVIYGPGFIEDTLCGCTYRIFSKTVFPLNPAQAEKLYRTAMEFAGLTGRERVLDAGCGSGILSLMASRSAKRVLSVEQIEGALREARGNLALNDTQNVKTVLSDPCEYIAALARSHEHFDVAFADNCRSRFLPEQLGALAPKRIVMLSADPEKLSRHLETLTRCGYTVQQAKAFDTLPFTSHVEAVVLLSRA